MGLVGGGVRRRRRRIDGTDESVEPDASERPRRRDDADTAADGGTAACRRPPRELRPADLLELPGEPPGRAGSQHHPGPALGLGLRLDRQRQLRIGDPHPRAGRPRHRPALLGHARPAEPPRGRDGARVLPGAPGDGTRSFSDFTQMSEGFGADPVLARGYGADFNDTAYPVDPGPRPALHAGQTASWFFGETLEPETVTVVLVTPAGPGTLVRFGSLRADGPTDWGAALPVPAGARRVTGPHPAGQAIGLSVQVVAGSIPDQRAVITVAGQPYELAGSLSSALTARVRGNWAGSPGLCGLHACASRPSPSSPRPTPVAASRRGPSRARRSPSRSGGRTDARPSVIRSVAWDSGWTATVSVNGGKAGGHHGRTTSTWSSRCTSRPATTS